MTLEPGTYRRRLLPTLLLFLSLSGLAYAAGSPDPAPSRDPAGQVIRIGSWGPLSGPNAPWAAILRGAAAFFTQINHQGGLHGRQLKLVMFDDRSDPAVTEAGVRTLVEEKNVLAFVGGVGTASGLAVLDYLDEKRIPWVGMISGSGRFAVPPRPAVFAVRPTDRDEASALVKYGVEVLNHRRIAVVHDDGPFGQDGLAGVLRRLEMYNLAPAAAIAVKNSDYDLKDKVQALEQARPETVIMWLTPVQAAVLRREAAGLPGGGPVWMTNGSLADAALLDKMTDGLWAGTIFTTWSESPADPSPLMEKYRRAHEEYAARGDNWGAFFCAGFGFAEPLIEALRRCGPELGRERLVSELEGLKDFKGVFGRISYGPRERQGQKELFIAQALRGGRTRPLTGWFVMD
ncbi:MAG: ABC transporter substrate-binding protein [Thermodesulfobacteriota bacterium]